MRQLKQLSVDQEKVKELLEKGVKPYSAAKILGLPTSVTTDISKGKFRPTYYRKGKRIPTDKKLCECCGTNEVHDGFSKLCYKCWRNA